MGQSQTHYQTLLGHSPKEWFTIGSHHSYQIIKNKNAHQLANEYIIPVQDQKTLARQLEIYQYRRLQMDNIVTVLEIQKLQTKSLCSNMIVLKVLTERIPHRISDVVTLTLPEALYILKTALLGFRTIYQYDGPLLIDEQMIGFNENGKVKIWLNPIFGSNQRSHTNKSFLNNKGSPENGYQNQLNMIQTIFNLTISKLPNEIQQNIRTKLGDISGFFSALNFVDDYAQSTAPANKISQQAFSIKKIREPKLSESKSKKEVRQYSLSKKPNMVIPRLSKVELRRNKSLRRLDEGIKGLGTSREKTKQSTSSNNSTYKQIIKSPYGLQPYPSQANLNKNEQYKRLLPPLHKPFY